jgi:hypothetical protein
MTSLEMTPLELVISKLKAADCPPWLGASGHQARCPVHRGNLPSLFVKSIAGGRVSLECCGRDDSGQPTCPTEAIVAALGLRMEDLQPQRALGSGQCGVDLVGWVSEAQPTNPREGGLRRASSAHPPYKDDEDDEDQDEPDDEPAEIVPIRLPQWPEPLTAGVLDGLAGEVVRLIEPSTEADPVALLLQLLVGFGNAIGSGVHVRADAHLHHANEYVVTVGETSRARKGTAWRQVRAFLAHVDPDWVANKITSGLSSGEGLIWEVRDPIPGPDQKTGQPMMLDPGVEDKRVLVIEGEFGNVLRVLTRQGNTLSGVLRLGWDGDDLRSMTKQSPVKATQPHVSLAGHITQHELTKYLSEVEVFSGLGNRILWAAVKRSKILPCPEDVDPTALAQLGSRLGAAAELARGLVECAGRPPARRSGRAPTAI